MIHPEYEKFLHRVRKPGRYVGGEYGSGRGRAKDAPVSIALAFPDTYEIGMSYLGFRILYDLLDRHDWIAVERAFAPWKDMEEELRARNLPLVSLETATPLRDFDVIGFSLQYELTFTNILQILDLGGIALRAASRGEGDPIVIAGGPIAFHPEPVAPFFDAIVLGDGEEILPRLLEIHRDARSAGASRRDILARFAALGCVYVPAFYGAAEDPLSHRLVVGPPLDPAAPPRIAAARVDRLDDHPFPTGGPVPATEIVFDRASIEIARGCVQGCRFCQGGLLYRPVRERDPEAVTDTVLRSVRETGFDEVSLTSLSTADYSAIEPLVLRLMEALRDERVSLSVSSLRAYGLSDLMLDAIAQVRNTNLTLAPEAGTQRMRDVINKNVTEEELIAAARRIFSRGWRRVKLYFMIGLPTETDED
ncbi:MAG: TIGR03960 family B12-binding radical SAM protein, partial [Planctomycetes bacterium]|nr:TIGR03960 family B12-binding radical SAM protein [Planctomycetota bacterium]